MGRRGPKPKPGVRTACGRLAQSNAAFHARGRGPYAAWCVYVATAGGFTKIGYSGNVRSRLSRLQHEFNTTLRLLGVVRLKDEGAARKMERDLQARATAIECHYEGEWFDISPETVRALLLEQRERGQDVLIAEAYPAEHRAVPRHAFSDADGRKFGSPWSSI